jgi:hypothetical protein
VEHEPVHADARRIAAPVAEAVAPRPAAAAQLLRLQRGAGNRAAGGLLKRRLARAGTETAPRPGLTSPPFTIPPASPALEIIPIFNGYRAQLRDCRDAFVAYKGNCADAALASFRKLTDKGLYAVSGHQPGLRTYDRTDPQSGRSGAVDWAQTDLNWNPRKVREVTDYIKAKIDQALPVFVGVNEADTEQAISPRTARPINDGITDHFLIIAGYTAENRGPGLYPYDPSGWRVTQLHAIDNAIKDPERSFPTFDVSRYTITKEAWPEDKGRAADAEYQLTQVRVYAEDVQRMRAAAAWWD